MLRSHPVLKQLKQWSFYCLARWYRLREFYYWYAPWHRRASSGPIRIKQSLRRFEKKIYSQNGEDGLLLYILSRICIRHHTFVEIGGGDGKECNTAQFSLQWNWSGLLLDADAANIAQAQQHYQAVLGPAAVQVTMLPARVTAENVNTVLAPYYRGEIDVLSIDIDGIDYWVWQALSVIDPRVVIIEYNASLGPVRQAVVRYAPVFDRWQYHPSGYYHGASLTALMALAQRKGYVLVGCDSAGVNALFVKRQEAAGRLQPLTPAQAFYPCLYRTTDHASLERQYALTQAMDFVAG